MIGFILHVCLLLTVALFNYFAELYPFSEQLLTRLSVSILHLSFFQSLDIIFKIAWLYYGLFQGYLFTGKKCRTLSFKSIPLHKTATNALPPLLILLRQRLHLSNKVQNPRPSTVVACAVFLLRRYVMHPMLRKVWWLEFSLGLESVLTFSSESYRHSCLFCFWLQLYYFSLAAAVDVSVAGNFSMSSLSNNSLLDMWQLVDAAFAAAWNLRILKKWGRMRDCLSNHTNATVSRLVIYHWLGFLTWQVPTAMHFNGLDAWTLFSAFTPSEQIGGWKELPWNVQISQNSNYFYSLLFFSLFEQPVVACTVFNSKWCKKIHVTELLILFPIMKSVHVWLGFLHHNTNLSPAKNPDWSPIRCTDSEIHCHTNMVTCS